MLLFRRDPAGFLTRILVDDRLGIEPVPSVPLEAVAVTTTSNQSPATVAELAIVADCAMRETDEEFRVIGALRMLAPFL